MSLRSHIERIFRIRPCSCVFARLPFDPLFYFQIVTICEDEADAASCWDLNYNIRRGAQLFSQKIAAAGGNVIQAIGAYNGWQPGLTVASATAAKNFACRNQNNLDYLHQARHSSPLLPE